MSDGVELIRFLLVGLVSGWIAAILVRGSVRGSVRVRGCLTYMVIGVIGALLAGYLFRALNISEVGSVVTATAGAIIPLVLVRMLRNR